MQAFGYNMICWKREARLTKSFAKLLGRKNVFYAKIDIFSAAKLRYTYSKFIGS